MDVQSTINPETTRLTMHVFLFKVFKQTKAHFRSRHQNNQIHYLEQEANEP